MTSRKENIEAERGRAAWFFFLSTIAAEHKSDNETLPLRPPPPSSQEGVCKWGAWPKSNSRARPLIANYRPGTPINSVLREWFQTHFCNPQKVWKGKTTLWMSGFVVNTAGQWNEILSRCGHGQFFLRLGTLSHGQSHVTCSWFQCDFPFISCKPKVLLCDFGRLIWQPRTQLPHMKHTSSVPIKVLPSTLQMPRVYTSSTHNISSLHQTWLVCSWDS